MSFPKFYECLLSLTKDTKGKYFELFSYSYLKQIFNSLEWYQPRDLSFLEYYNIPTNDFGIDIIGVNKIQKILYVVQCKFLNKSQYETVSWKHCANILACSDILKSNVIFINENWKIKKIITTTSNGVSKYYHLNSENIVYTYNDFENHMINYDDVFCKNIQDNLNILINKKVLIIKNYKYYIDSLLYLLNEFSKYLNKELTIYFDLKIQKECGYWIQFFMLNIDEDFEENKTYDVIVSSNNLLSSKSVYFIQLLNGDLDGKKEEYLFDKYSEEEYKKCFDLYGDIVLKYTLSKFKKLINNIRSEKYYKTIQTDPKSKCRINQIKEINHILGIKDSCEKKIFSINETNIIIENIIPKYKEICNIFNIKEQILKESISINKQKREQVRYLLDQIFLKWNGSRFISRSIKVMRERKRYVQYWFEKKISGNIREDENYIIISLLSDLVI